MGLLNDGWDSGISHDSGGGEGGGNLGRTQNALLQVCFSTALENVISTGESFVTFSTPQMEQLEEKKCFMLFPLPKAN